MLAAVAVMIAVVCGVVAMSDADRPAAAGRAPAANTGTVEKGTLSARVSGAGTLTYRARSFVLATGGFASAGLELDTSGKVREPVFDLPVAGLPAQNEPLFEPSYFDEHALSRVGVAVDASRRPVDGEGEPVYENLHAAGATLAGAVPWREGSGNGLSLASGYAAASAILEATS